MPPVWAHRSLIAYQKALVAAELLDAYARSIPRGRADLRDELRRTSTSMLINLAEGANEFSGPEKARFYRMSRRSAAECATILELCEKILHPRIPPSEADALLDEIASMLAAMILRQDRARPSPSSSSASSSSSSS